MSKDSSVGLPIVSGKERLTNPAMIDKTPIRINGNEGLTSLRTSVMKGAGEAPTRAKSDAKLNPWVLQNKQSQMCQGRLLDVTPK